MDRAFPTRNQRRRGLGYPVLPDSWPGWAFSPGTPDATQMAVLKQFGGTLPPNLQAKWDAAQGVISTTAQPAPPITPTPAPPVAVTPSGTPVSTQTGQVITLRSTINVAPGVWSCVMSDGSSHYCDANQNPISYTPPPPPPVIVPGSGSQPTSTVAPAVAPIPPPTGTTAPPVAVTPAGGQISTTTGTPTSAGVVAAAEGAVESLMTWFKGSLIGGVPNWMLLGGAAAALMMLGGEGSAPRRRR